MTGLELSKKYFFEACKPVLEREIPEKLDRIAACLVGEGSDCFGWDDEISRDHGWGPRVCLVLTQADMEDFGDRLKEIAALFPGRYEGYPVRLGGGLEGKRGGIYTVGEFYTMLIGLPRAPETLGEWMSVPEVSFAAAVNGEVFRDPAGEFTAVRNALLDFYPEDARLRLLARHAATAAQTGQYNLVRSRLRGENVAACVIKGRFAESAAAMIFLLNRRYRPFYKWAFRALRELPLLGPQAYGLLEKMMGSDDPRHESSAAEELSALIIDELRSQSLTGSGSDFLMDHTGELLSRIRDSALRTAPVSLAF
ncbi:MAG: DUF4037 domain-containing protein [Clostridiales bacterium]|jgi:hypothetical protein|nr:DUF4037 domain-containing protein [Clostridiales bacterium]